MCQIVSPCLPLSKNSIKTFIRLSPRPFTYPPQSNHKYGGNPLLEPQCQPKTRNSKYLMASMRKFQTKESSHFDPSLLLGKSNRIKTHLWAIYCAIWIHVSAFCRSFFQLWRNIQCLNRVHAETSQICFYLGYSEQHQWSKIPNHREKKSINEFSLLVRMDPAQMNHGAVLRHLPTAHQI